MSIRDRTVDSSQSSGGGSSVPPGEYKYKILAVEEFTSKSGKPCSKLTLKLESEGRTSQIDEIIAETESCDWRWITLFKSCKLIPDGYSGVLPFDKLVGAMGRCSTKNEQNGNYTNSRVDRFLVQDEAIAESDTGW